MARQYRPYFPGAIYHVTARTHGGQLWFDEATREFICDCLATVQRRLDATLLAFVIMPNHLHLALQQGDHPIGRFMQPLLTRIAISIGKKYDLIGHVFGSRYWSAPCVSAEYVAACIRYVHNNPVRAQLCATASEYRWSSAACYDGNRAPGNVIVNLLPVIDATSSWQHPISANSRVVTTPLRSIERIVSSVISECDLEIDVDDLRLMRGRIPAAIRRVCISRAVEAGYRNCQIARFLRIGPSTVSAIASQVRGNARLAAAYVNEPKTTDGPQTPKKIGQPKLPYSHG